MRFPKEFMVGAATAAHQVEGNNTNSDFWYMEHMVHTSFTEKSLEAADHYNRYKEDIKMLADAGMNAYRFSIEWARIEPNEGEFDESQVDHYRDVIRCCHSYGVEPVITLMHFSSPKWLISKGGWEADTTPEDFARYAAYVMERIGSEVKYVCTINEVNMGVLVAGFAKLREKQLKKLGQSDDKSGQIQMGINMDQMLANKRAAAAENMEVFGVESPQCFNYPRTEQGDRLVMKAHVLAREAIRRVCPDVKIGMSLSLHDIQCVPGGEKNAEDAWTQEFSHYLPAMDGDDFIGVQNYCRARYDSDGSMPAPDGAELTQMKFEFYPDSVGPVIRRVAESFKGEIIVTENGVAVSDDTRRVEFIRSALSGVRECIDDGLPVKGYFYWSLMDNFEWQKGYSMTFGLAAVDRTTQMRTPKPSLNYLGSFCTR